MDGLVNLLALFHTAVVLNVRGAPAEAEHCDVHSFTAVLEVHLLSVESITWTRSTIHMSEYECIHFSFNLCVFIEHRSQLEKQVAQVSISTSARCCLGVVLGCWDSGTGAAAAAGEAHPCCWFLAGRWGAM